jgi:hypothetical protein
MRPVCPALPRLFTAVCGLLALAAAAQTPAADPREDNPAPLGRPEQKIERIRHEDAGSRIDELRVGGETKRITVKPKGDAPAYEVGPEGSNRNPASTDRERGDSRRGWKLFNF